MSNSDRSADLLISMSLETEILLLNHTGYGLTTFTDDELNSKLSDFFSYKDPEEHILEQIKKVRSHPWIAKDGPVSGFIF